MPHRDDLTAPNNKAQPKKADEFERKEQREFAAWLSLEDYPFEWKATHKKATGTVGCPDFVVGVAGLTLWIEFKRPGFKLSDDQETFRGKLERQGIYLHVVYSADQGIKLVKGYDVIV